MISGFVMIVGVSIFAFQGGVALVGAALKERRFVRIISELQSKAGNRTT
jgi:hypothetical protein